MTAEFNANKAREFTIKREEINAELWYSKYKDSLFHQIQSVCLSGHDRLLIDAKQWENKELYRHHLTQKLESLGYKINVRINWQNDEEMIVSW